MGIVREKSVIVDPWMHWMIVYEKKKDVLGHWRVMIVAGGKVLLHESTLSWKERKWNCAHWWWVKIHVSWGEIALVVALIVKANKRIRAITIWHMHHKPIRPILSSSRFMLVSLLDEQYDYTNTTSEMIMYCLHPHVQVFILLEFIVNLIPLN